MKLSDLQTANHHFTIAAFDHRSSLIDLLQLPKDNTEELTHQMLELKSLFMRVFSPMSSAVLTDPIYGLKSLKEKAEGCAALLSLEESSYDAVKTDVPKFVDNWGVEEIKGYEGAAKLLLYINPQEGKFQQKLEFVQQISRDAKLHEVPFLLELVLFPVEDKTEFEHNWSHLQEQVVEQFDQYCDVLKLEYPGLYAKSDDQAKELCSRITLTSNVPWIILSRGMQYDKFKHALEISMLAGASGFAVGRAVWQEIDEVVKDSPDWQNTYTQIEHFLYSNAQERYKKLVEIAEG